MRLVILPLAGFILLALAFRPQPVAADESRSTTILVTVVDEGDKPAGGANVRSIQDVDDGDELVVTADAAGTCRIPRPLSGRSLFLHLIATDGTGQRQGSVEADLRDPEYAGKPLRVALKASRGITIRVTGPTGAAIGDALVGLIGGRLGRDLAHGRTGKDGSVRLQFPADTVVRSVFALKPGSGFDYWSAARGVDQSEEQENRDVPEALTLALNGAQMVRIRAADSAGNPVPGLAVRPWAIVKPGRPGIVNSHFVDTPTDEHGVATIDWLPIDFNQVLFGLHSMSHVRVRIPGLLKTDVKPGTIPDVTISVLRLTKLSGRVKGADGTPAVGIHVQAEGRLARASSRTGADGVYEMNVRPETVYMVSVVDDDWAAPCRGRVVVREDVPVGGIDLELTNGTVIRGTVTGSRDKRPVAKESVVLEQTGDELPPQLQGLGDGARAEKFSRSAKTDARGRFQFRVGPGNYTLTNGHAAKIGPRRPGFGADAREQIRLFVDDEAEMVADLQAVGLETGVLAGTLAGPDGVPVKDAVVRGIYIEAYSANRPSAKSVSDAAGEFRMERQHLPMWLFVSTTDKSLAGRVRVEADQESVAVQLAPAATVVGRLIDGDAPVAGVEVALRLPLDIGPGGVRLASSFFEAGIATASADGRFVFPGLIVGEQYLVHVDRPGLPRLVVNVDRSGNMDLGYVELPRSQRATRTGRGTVFETDFEKLATDRFGVKTSLAARIQAALADAKREYRRVMLVAGDPQSQLTQALFKVLDRIDVDPGVMRVTADYRPLYINVMDQDAAAYLAKSYQLDVAKLGLPALVVLDENGAIAAGQSFVPAGDPPQLAADALHGFLKLHALPPRNAEEIIRAAVHRARDENKRILLQHSGPNSYGCRLLTRFIDQHRELFERDYVYVDLDAYRSIKGDEVMKQFREKGNDPPATRPQPGLAREVTVVPFGRTRGAVPWMAILSSDGVKLADSDGPDGNIGFPIEPEAINYFVDKMLKPTAERLTAEQLEELRKALQGK